MEETKPVQSVQETAQLQKDNLSILERTEAAIQKLELAEMRTREVLARNEAVLSRIMISGRAEAGSVPAPIISHEDRIKEENRRIFGSTGLI